MNKPRIGLVGVGLMGHGIALNIARKGYGLTVLEHPGNQPLDDLRALGVASAASVHDLVRQVEVLTGQGKSISEAVKTIAVTETTYFRWRAEFGGMKTDQVKRMKALELENARLRRAVSDLTLDKLILSEAARGNF